MAKQKNQMPSTAGGLVRYYDDEEALFRINPKWVVAVVTLFILFEIMLHWMGPRLL